MSACHTSPPDKKTFGRRVGIELKQRYGKKRFYTVQEVRSCMDNLGYPLDLHCWGLSLYTSPQDFAAYHAWLGETCDYQAMHNEMLVAVTENISSNVFCADWFSIDFADLPNWFDFFDVTR